jgi:hypothetical protein
MSGITKIIVKGLKLSDLILDKLHNVLELFLTPHNLVVHLIQITITIDSQNWTLL